MSRPLESTRISGLEPHRSAPIYALVFPRTNSVASPSLTATTRASSPRSSTPSTRSRDPHTDESPIDSDQITAGSDNPDEARGCGAGQTLRCVALRCVALRGPGPHSAYTENGSAFIIGRHRHFPPCPSVSPAAAPPYSLPPPSPPPLTHTPHCLPAHFVYFVTLPLPLPLPIPLPGKGASAFASSLTPRRVIPRSTFLSPLPTQPVADHGATLSLPCHKPFGPHTFLPGYDAR